jgi:hypothetical protein
MGRVERPPIRVLRRLGFFNRCPRTEITNGTTTMNRSNIVQLTPAEIYIAATAGIMRQTQNLKDNRTPGDNLGNSNNWQIHIEGCLAEMAVAKYLNFYWPGKGELRECDVGTVDVRSTSNMRYGLILHESDPDDRVFYLACGCNGKYEVRGWIRGEDGKTEENWRELDKSRNSSAWLVPAEQLNPPEMPPE